jgi:hypothetical protein
MVGMNVVVEWAPGRSGPRQVPWPLGQTNEDGDGDDRDAAGLGRAEGPAGFEPIDGANWLTDNHAIPKIAIEISAAPAAVGL